LNVRNQFRNALDYTACHFHPSLIFAGKPVAYPSGAPVRTAPGLALKYYTSVEVT